MGAQKSSKSSKRITGINVARAIAVVGMIIVNFKTVLGEQGPSWLQAAGDIFTGRASAVFVVLAGVGMSLMAKKAEGDAKAQRKVQLRIFKRALFLFALGLTYFTIWPADILHYYGVYMVVGLFFVFKPEAYSIRMALLLILVFAILLFNFDYEQSWDWKSLEYLDFWTVEGFARNLFFNGFHPFIPWAAFLFVGIWLGKKDLYDETFIIALLQRGLALFITILVLSPFAARQAVEVLRFTPDSAEFLFGTSPMPPNPMYMLSGVGIAFTVISLSILWAWRKKDSKVVQALDRTGQMALTYYVAHVVIGMSLPELFGSYQIGEFPLYFSLSYALVFSLACILFANWYIPKFKQGPLEWLLRRI